MKVFYFGSSRFSVPPMRAIADRLSAVVTKKAKPSGRGYLLSDNAVKEEALRLNLPVFEIGSFREEGAREIGDLRPDLLVVASYGLIIPRWFLDIPSIGSVNVHPSLLPRYRGPAPMQWALWNGETETGITLIKMTEKMDAGNIIYQEPVSIEAGENAEALSERLSARVAAILPDAVKRIESHGLDEGVVQDEAQATYTPMITKEMGRIDWTSGALEIERQVRALVEWPTAYTFLEGKLLKVFGARLEGSSGAETGAVIEAAREGIRVAAADGTVLLTEVQYEGRKRMSAYQFAMGHRHLAGTRLG